MYIVKVYSIHYTLRNVTKNAIFILHELQLIKVLQGLSL